MEHRIDIDDVVVMRTGYGLMRFRLKNIAFTVHVQRIEGAFPERFEGFPAQLSSMSVEMKAESFGPPISE